MQLNQVVLRSKQNPFVKDVARLKQKKARAARGVFIFEGEKLFLEAAGWQVALTDVILSESRYQKKAACYRDVFDKLSDDTRCTIVSDAVFAHLSNQVHPEGVLCIAKQPSADKPLADGNVLVLDGIRDPGNLGTMIRTADAAGFQAVCCLENTVDPYNDKTIRATMASLFHIQVMPNQNPAQLFKTLHARNTVICAASLKGDLSLSSPAGGKKTALVIGNESHGIRPEIEAACDVSWRLPIYGHAESLNAAVAAGILMYAVVRAQHN